MPPYSERFPVGTTVRVAERVALEQFIKDWKHHNPLDAACLPFAGRSATVREVVFYHGGDPLYTLEGIPGLWHEVCLRSSSGAT